MIPDDVKERIRGALDIVDVIGREVELKRSGASWKGLCPFHEDKTPSFDVNPSKGRFHCFGCGEQGDVFDWTMRRRAVGFRDAVTALAAEKGIPLDVAAPAGAESLRHPSLGEPSHVWTIRDVDGREVAKHARFPTLTKEGEPDKTFRWYANGRWALGTRSEDAPLYLCETIAARPGEPVVLTEGEKACDAVVARGLLAVGTVTGASSCPSVKALQCLKDRDVVLWPDADEPGRVHAFNLGNRLHGIAASVRVVLDEGAEKGDDAADWVKYGDEMFRAAVGAAVPFPGPLALNLEALDRPADAPPGPEPAAEADAEGLPWRTAATIAADVATRPPLVATWPGFLAPGKIAVLSGSPKAGKSEAVAAYVAARSRGTEWLGVVPAEPCDVILVTEESDDDVATKLGRYGADLDRVHVLNPDAGAAALEWGRLIGEIGATATATCAALVVVDTFASWAGLAGDDERNEGVVGPAVRRLFPLRAAGREVLLVHHTTKSPDAVGFEAVRGSGALSAEADAFAVFREVGRDSVSTKRTMSVWARRFGRSKYVIDRVVPTDGGEPHFRLITDDPAKDAKRDSFTADERKILAQLDREGGWLSKAQITEVTGIKARRLDDILPTLVASMRIERQRGGKKRTGFEYAKKGTRGTHGGDE